MRIVGLFTNRHVIAFGIKLSQLIPKEVALSIIERLTAVISRFKGSDLIQAIQANQHMVSGMDPRDQKDLDQRTRGVIRHALICYYDFFHNLEDLEKMSHLVPGVDEVLEQLGLMTANQGAFLISPHVSNFNVFLQVMLSKGFNCKVLTLSTMYSGYDLTNEIRKSAGAQIVSADAGDHYNELVEYLNRGGIVATAVDRPVQGRQSRNKLTFFGKPSALPAGYISLALASDVPVIILSISMNEDGIYDYELTGPIKLDHHPTRLDTIKKNAEKILRTIEPHIKRFPEQWLMYHPVWPQSKEETG